MTQRRKSLKLNIAIFKSSKWLLCCFCIFVQTYYFILTMNLCYLYKLHNLWIKLCFFFIPPEENWAIYDRSVAFQWGSTWNFFSFLTLCFNSKFCIIVKRSEWEVVLLQVQFSWVCAFEQAPELFENLGSPTFICCKQDYTPILSMVLLSFTAI